ncbi:MAG: hypothetical protein ABI603_12370 [Acidobacteriota bacterium]
MAKQDTPKDQAQQKDFPATPAKRDEQVRGIADTEVDDDADEDEDFDDSDDLDEDDEDAEGTF